MSNTHEISVGEPEGKRPLGRSMRRWVEPKKVGCEHME